MGAREGLLAAALMAMVNRSMATCAPCIRNSRTPKCSYGLERQCCSYVCLKGPGDACGGTRVGPHDAWIGSCGTGLVCQKPGNTKRQSNHYDWSFGTCVNYTTPAAECQSPWFLINNQCLRVVSGQEERRSSASADAYCGTLTAGADLAGPKNLTALSDHLGQNNFTAAGTYWLGVYDRYGYATDDEDCTELLPGIGLGYGVHHLNDWSCKKNNNFICERHYWQGWHSLFSTY